MEILNYVLSSMIVIISPLSFVKILLNTRVRKNKIRILLILTISFITYMIIFTNLTGIFRSICNFLMCTLLINHFYEIRFDKSIFSTITFILLLIIPEILSILIMINIFNMSKEQFYIDFASSWIGNLLVYVLMILITFILKKQLRKILNIKLDYNKKIIIISILTLISVLVFFFDIISNFRIGSKIILYIVAIITFVTILIFLIYEENKNINLKIEYEKLLEFMQTYEVELEKEKVSKHEHKNELIAIKSKLIDKDNNDNVIAYIDELLGDESKFSLEGYTQFQYLPPNGIKALFYFKISEARSKGINTNINIIPSVSNSILKDLNAKQFKDLGVLIGVYLDNAIEASELSEKKVLGIEIYNDLDNVEIIISNSYVGNIEVAKIGKEKFSTKGKNRGHGLLLVKQTLIKNNKLVTENEITSNLYIQTIIIKK